MTTNYSKAFVDCAVFTPSIRVDFSINTYGHNTLKRISHFTSEDLNFLNPKTSLFFYPYALYSATNQAAIFSPTENVISQNLTLPIAKDNIVFNRDRSQTTVLGDSGGYSVATTSAKTFNGEDMVRRVLHWLEHQFDYCATLDIPTWAIQNRNIDIFRKRFAIDEYLPDWEAISNMNEDYAACLYLTVAHNIIYMEHCQRVEGTILTHSQEKQAHPPQSLTPRTRFLNVVQGRNLTEATFWYDKVRQFPFDNWAFAGDLSENIKYLTSLLSTMRNDFTLKSADTYDHLNYKTLPTARNCQWIHLLGNNKANLAVEYTSLMRSVNKSAGTDIQVSFDSITYSLDWITQANHIYTGFYLDQNRGWRITHASPSAYANANTAAITLRDWIHLEADKEFTRLGIKADDRYYADTEVSAKLDLVGPADALLFRNAAGVARKDDDALIVGEHHNLESFLMFLREANNRFSNRVKLPANIIDADRLIALAFC